MISIELRNKNAIGSRYTKPKEIDSYTKPNEIGLCWREALGLDIQEPRHGGLKQ